MFSVVMPCPVPAGYCERPMAYETAFSFPGETHICPIRFFRCSHIYSQCKMAQLLLNICKGHKNCYLVSRKLSVHSLCTCNVHKCHSNCELPLIQMKKVEDSSLQALDPKRLPRAQSLIYLSPCEPPLRLSVQMLSAAQDCCMHCYRTRSNQYLNCWKP